MSSLQEIVETCDICLPYGPIVLDVEDWQTLKTAVLAQQTNNNHSDEIAAIISEYGAHKYIGCESCVRIIKRLRQLSAVKK